MIFEKIDQNSLSELQLKYKALSYRMASVNSNLTFNFENNDDVSGNYELSNENSFEGSKSAKMYSENKELIKTNIEPNIEIDEKMDSDINLYLFFHHKEFQQNNFHTVSYEWL